MNVLDELLGSMPSIGVLSDSKFFEPRETFFEKMEPYRSFVIYDIGAGMGHVSKSLLDRKYNCLAIDRNPRENTDTPVLLANSVTYQYEPGSIVMFCRPCHNGFVAATIRQAERCNVAAIIYVSKSQNKQLDLGSFVHKFHTIGHRVGHKHESMYVMTR